MTKPIHLILGFAVCATLSASSISLGSINGQDGWSGGNTGSISLSVDQEVTNAASRSGIASFRASNRDFNGNF